MEGLEPPASGFGDRRSSQLSYTPARRAGVARTLRVKRVRTGRCQGERDRYSGELPGQAALPTGQAQSRVSLLSMGQYACIAVKMNAVLMPNKSIPSVASSAPIICQWRSSISPEAPRVLRASTE